MLAVNFKLTTAQVRLLLQLAYMDYTQLDDDLLVIPRREGVDPALPVGDKRWVEGFRRVWEDINGKRTPWESNPWVWVLEFRRVKP